ncbi:tyrosine-type recombinase/integrase [Actinoplanes oblitus]
MLTPPPAGSRKNAPSNRGKPSRRGTPHRTQPLPSPTSGSRPDSRTPLGDTRPGPRHRQPPQPARGHSRHHRRLHRHALGRTRRTATAQLRPRRRPYPHQPETGALHEIAGTLELGPPKTPAAVRSIALPPFLVTRLREHLDSHDHAHVFAGADGGLHRRSNFARRFWRPATDGDPKKLIAPVIPGMHFHDLRHTHKTWMIEDGVPEVAQAKRLGHRLPGVRGIYSRVSPAVEQRLVDGPRKRWQATGER